MGSGKSPAEKTNFSPDRQFVLQGLVLQGLNHQLKNLITGIQMCAEYGRGSCDPGQKNRCFSEIEKTVSFFTNDQLKVVQYVTSQFPSMKESVQVAKIVKSISKIFIKGLLEYMFTTKRKDRDEFIINL